jgi:hypothetical protein
MTWPPPKMDTTAPRCLGYQQLLVHGFNMHGQLPAAKEAQPTSFIQSTDVQLT